MTQNTSPAAMERYTELALKQGRSFDPERGSMTEESWALFERMHRRLIVKAAENPYNASPPSRIKFCTPEFRETCAPLA